MGSLREHLNEITTCLWTRVIIGALLIFIVVFAVSCSTEIVEDDCPFWKPVYGVHGQVIDFYCDYEHGRKPTSRKS